MKGNGSILVRPNNCLGVNRIGMHWTNEYACLGYGTDLVPALADFCELTGVKAILP
jgi:hypothetical protein